MTKLFQHQTLGDLMAGFFDGSMTISLIKRGQLWDWHHGPFRWGIDRD